MFFAKAFQLGTYGSRSFYSLFVVALLVVKIRLAFQVFKLEPVGYIINHCR
ncbi:hypothetical protein D3C86_1396950 [compost metagenome]